MAGNPRLDLVEHRNGRTDLARRAIAALVSVVLDEGRLHRAQLVGRSEPLDRRDTVAVMHDRECQAGVDPSPVDDDGAGAALAVIAALLRTSKMQMFAQCIEQRGPRVQLQFMRLAVDAKG